MMMMMTAVRKRGRMDEWTEKMPVAFELCKIRGKKGGRHRISPFLSMFVVGHYSKVYPTALPYKDSAKGEMEERLILYKPPWHK